MNANKNSEETPTAAPVHRLEIDEIVKLNIGGHKFTTTRKTLCHIPGSFFESMLRHGRPALNDEEGYYFIDRDGTNFQHVLNFLRDGFLREDVVVETLDAAAKKQLVVEADYYGLDGLKNDLLRPKVDISAHLDESTLSIRHEEDNLRRAFASRQANGLDQYVGLIPLFCPDHGVQPLPLPFQPRVDDKGLKVYMNKIHEQAQAGTPVTVSSLEEFRANFDQEHDGILDSLENVLLEEPVIIAGGSVLRALTASNGIRTSQWWGKKSDIDFFLYNCTPEEANRIAKRIFCALPVGEEETWRSNRWVVVRCSGVINMHLQDDVYLSDLDWCIRDTCQIVLRLYDSPAEVLLGFDLDCCCCAYDGRAVWVTRRCLMALQTGINVLNPLHSWPNKPSYEVRLAKYASRGFSVAVPGLDESLIDYHRIHDADIGELKGLARLLKVAFNTRGVPETVPSYGNGPNVALIPSVYDRTIGEDGRWRLRDLRRFGHLSPNGPRDYRLMFRCGDRFYLSQENGDEAWEEIIDAGPSVPTGLPRRLEDAWVFEKRSREYMNSNMDKFYLDNTYYSEAYRTV